ncbi:hydroxyisourate hydrolase [Burkholderia cenocepacia]|uniref:hydroxyisourate hydrolase n=1 Tax=Burkholderia cenocepacia TaxID=95486 RepID=UPI0028661D59|nr:hydroxyisourate hydrolase [Burkholderia cenocepacia]MDR5665682.1 hydroxyisourate hydrolase [Burkholderia cenocepacia]MDR5668695.1 hydroxyisourate hydrolase [Burkholderia cenocepacia]MDR8096619.1 hydroxyisourate hydrolase [Burkholderia cenocepacia]
MTGISTHVLDIASGQPLVGVRIELYDMGETPPLLVARAASNVDGRNDAPMLDGDLARRGDFELRFHLGEYFKEADALLDVVPVRFTVTDPAQHHHVPLLCSPWYVSTYRGS